MVTAFTYLVVALMIAFGCAIAAFIIGCVVIPFLGLCAVMLDHMRESFSQKVPKKR